MAKKNKSKPSASNDTQTPKPTKAPNQDSAQDSAQDCDRKQQSGK
jgi:hypothetical protein